MNNISVYEKSMDEVDSYRAIGTVERFEQLSKQFAPHNVDETSCHLRQCNKCDMYRKENEKYHAIGTIEEFKALKEKSVAKKAKWHPNPCAEDNRIPICPNCNTIMVRTEIFGRTIDEHCVSCGQKLDWNE